MTYAILAFGILVICHIGTANIVSFKTGPKSLDVMLLHSKNVVFCKLKCFVEMGYFNTKIIGEGREKDPHWEQPGSQWLGHSYSLPESIYNT